MKKEVRLSSKGQIVLPREIREALGLQKGSLLRIEVVGNTVVLTPTAGEGLPSPQEWRSWRGTLRGAGLLQELLNEHRREREQDARRGD